MMPFLLRVVSQFVGISAFYTFHILGLVVGLGVYLHSLPAEAS